MPLVMNPVMASGAFPPAFPPVRIAGEYYWDGGILSNTPTEAIFDDYPRRDSVVFGVNVWNPMGPEPKTMWDVLHRQKDIQYSRDRKSTRLNSSHQIISYAVFCLKKKKKKKHI